MSNNDYKRYKNMAVVICNGDNNMADDLLQDTLLYFMEKNIESEKLTDNYIFMSLKNRYLNNVTRGKKFDDNVNLNELEVFDENLEDKKILEDDNYSKLMLVKNNISKLNEFEKLLFSLVIIKNIKQSDISKKTGLSRSLLSYRYVRLKNKLRDGEV